MRDYSQQVVTEHIVKVVFGKQPPPKDPFQQGVYFVTSYHPKCKDLGKFLKKLQLFLCSDSEVQRVFSPAPIVSYRSARKIRTDYIIR